MSAEELRLEERRRSAPFHLLLGQIGTAQPGGDEWFNRDTHPERRRVLERPVPASRRRVEAELRNDPERLRAIQTRMVRAYGRRTARTAAIRRAS
jgi:hypothetical protein